MSWLEKLSKIDELIVKRMSKWGPTVECMALAIVFAWFGTLKLFGFPSASSIVAKTVYFFEPEITVPFLGAWEVAIGVSLVIPSLHRVAVFLLLTRLPGTLFALFFKMEVCFDLQTMVPTTQGQYLLKELTLVGAALVIGGHVRSRRAV